MGARGLGSGKHVGASVGRALGSVRGHLWAGLWGAYGVMYVMRVLANQGGLFSANLSRKGIDQKQVYGIRLN